MYEHAYLRVICRDDMKTVRRPSDRDSSIRVTLASFQDGRHGPKMAAMTPRWPPWLQDGHHHLEGQTDDAFGGVPCLRLR